VAPAEGGDVNSPDTGMCHQLACPCSGSAACDSQICGDKLTVGAGLFATTGNSFCTKPCCTSADCDPFTVCYATESGNSLCVLPAWLNRSSQLGTKVGGDACAANSDCRSGLCAGSACADTCCSTAATTSECAAGTTCGFVNFPGLVSFDQGYIANCAAGGTGTEGSSCSSNSDCQSNFCDSPPGGACRDACRNSSECGPGAGCAYVLPIRGSPTVIALCLPQQLGNVPQGGSCTQDQQCVTGFCRAVIPADAMAAQCTDVCYGDSDCPVPGWHCRPQYEALHSGGMASVMLCGM
jgi:hypothetical protein